MKRIYFLAACLVAASALFAQMTVWSNGQSVYNRPVENVDSISFATATSAQVNQQTGGQAATSLEGKIYLLQIPGVSSVAGSGHIEPKGLVFYSATEGYCFDNVNSFADRCKSFTYTISGRDIVITAGTVTVSGKIVADKMIVLTETSNVNYPPSLGAYFLW